MNFLQHHHQFKLLKESESSCRVRKPETRRRWKIKSLCNFPSPSIWDVYVCEWCRNSLGFVFQYENTLQGLFCCCFCRIYGEMWKISYFYVNEQARRITELFSTGKLSSRLRHENDIYQNLSRIGINFICSVIMKYWSRISHGRGFMNISISSPDHDILR